MVLENIVFAGGGLKGWAYIGTIKALNELIDFKNIKSVTGVSVGSMFGLFYILVMFVKQIKLIQSNLK
jgi:predicted acylesterase/phospholipase RssA